jgi:hypothetical protein
MPSNLVGSLSGLTQGRFPVYAKARYADDLAERSATRRRALAANASVPVDAGSKRRGIDIFAAAGSPVIAVQDGRIVAAGRTRRLGNFVRLTDAYGNTYTYAQLKMIAARVAVPKARTHGKARKPTTPQAAPKLRSYLTGEYTLKPEDVVLKALTRGTRVIAGTILGRIGTTSRTVAAHMRFEIKPAGRGAPRVDPKPILDGWKLLEATAIYRAKGTNPLAGAGAGSASIGQIMLMSKQVLARRVLSNPRIEIYPCGRRDVEAGGIDRRVLATLEFLAASGLKPTVTSLHCGHSYYTAAGNISEHSAGSAVDIAMINGIPILGHQGPGSIADITIRRLLTLQGTAKPHQIISLMTYPGTDNTLALPDHADHIHVGYRPPSPPGSPAAIELAAILRPSQWLKLIDRLGHIANPVVTRTPSKYAIDTQLPRGSAAHEDRSPRGATLP